MKLSKKMFKDVVAYIFSEPGAMGLNGTIECLKASGEIFRISYLDEETNWNVVKENFEGMNECIFNGPHPNVVYSGNVMAIGRNNNIVTTINEGWREICFDAGNHFVCKEEYARGFIDFFKGMESYEIVCDGMRKIKEANFMDSLDSIADKPSSTKGKIIGWNINQRSSLGKEIPQLVVNELVEQDADIIVLTEMYKTKNLESFWEKMKIVGYDYVVNNNDNTNEVAILWKQDLFAAASTPETLISAKDNLNPNFLMIDLQDKAGNLLTVVGYRIRICFNDTDNEYKYRAQQMNVVMEQVRDKSGHILMVTDSNNLRRGITETDWNLNVLDRMLSGGSFIRHTPKGSSIFVEHPNKGADYEFAEDHIVSKSVNVSEIEYDREFVSRDKEAYIWGRDFCHKDEQTGKYTGIAPGFPDHAIIKGYFEFV